jgi:uncharacterized membrane protein YqjE
MPQEDKPGRGERTAGLIGSLRTLLATVVAMAHTRLELAGAEVREEFARLGAVLLYGYLALFFGSVGVMLLTLAFVVLLWEEHRLAVLGGAGVLFLLVTALSARHVLALVRRKPRLFDASLRELERDREQLTGHEPGAEPRP